MHDPIIDCRTRRTCMVSIYPKIFGSVYFAAKSSIKQMRTFVILEITFPNDHISADFVLVSLSKITPGIFMGRGIAWKVAPCKKASRFPVFRVQCLFRDEGYITNRELFRHTLWHSPEYPFECRCSVCHLWFRYPHQLLTHKRTYSQTKLNEMKANFE